MSGHNTLIVKCPTHARTDNSHINDSIPMNEKNRYSDEELEEFRILILKKLEKARNEYEKKYNPFL